MVPSRDRRQPPTLVRPTHEKDFTRFLPRHRPVASPVFSNFSGSAHGFQLAASTSCGSPGCSLAVVSLPSYLTDVLHSYPFGYLPTRRLSIWLSLTHSGPRQVGPLAAFRSGRHCTVIYLFSLPPPRSQPWARTPSPSPFSPPLPRTGPSRSNQHRPHSPIAVHLRCIFPLGRPSLITTYLPTYWPFRLL